MSSPLPSSTSGHDDPSSSGSQSLYNTSVVVLQAAPLVYYDSNQKTRALSTGELKAEQKLLTSLLEDSRSISTKFDVLTPERLWYHLKTTTSPILQISCMGRSDLLMAEDDREWGLAKPLLVDRLQDIVASVKNDQIKVVFVASVDSRALAEMFVESGVQHVISCAERVPRTAYEAFAKNFYSCLAESKTIQASYNFANEAASIESLEKRRQYFYLLPALSNHDVKVFNASSAINPHPVQEFNILDKRILPDSDPRGLQDNQVELFFLLKSIKNKMLVETPNGRLCKVASQFIRERSRVFNIVDIHWVDPRYSTYCSDGISYSLHEASKLALNDTDYINNADFQKFSDTILKEVRSKEVLIFFDAKAFSLEEQMNRAVQFIQFLRENLPRTRLVIICSSELKIPPFNDITITDTELEDTKTVMTAMTDTTMSDTTVTDKTNADSTKVAETALSVLSMSDERLKGYDHIKIDVIDATREVVFSIANSGVGKGHAARGCLFIVGNGSLICSKKEKFGQIELPFLDFSEYPWGAKNARYNVLDIFQQEDASSFLMKGIRSICKEDGGVVIDGITGDVWAGSFLVDDLSFGITSGGSRSKAASSIAEQAGGCFVIKLSTKFCGSKDSKLPSDATIEVYAGTNKYSQERIPPRTRGVELPNKIRVSTEVTSGVILSVAWSPDGTRVVSGSTDKTIRIYDTIMKKDQKLVGHTDWVSCVAYSPDGARIASGSRDKTIRLWDVISDKFSMILKGHTAWLTSVAWSPDGFKVASGSTDNTIRIWNSSTGDCDRIMKGHTNDVWSIVWSPNGMNIASGSYDRTVRLWNINTGDCCGVLKGHSGLVSSVAWSPDGISVVSGSSDKTIRLWGVNNSHCLKILLGHTRKVSSVSWCPDATKVVSGSEDKTLRIWKIGTGECLAALEGHTHWVQSVAWSPDSARVVSGSWDKTVKLWDVNSGIKEDSQMDSLRKDPSPVRQESNQDTLYDEIDIIQSDPLVWENRRNGTLQSYTRKHQMSDFQNEKDVLDQVFRQIQTSGGTEIKVSFHLGTMANVEKVFACNKSPIVHFAGPGHLDYLPLEHETKLGTLQGLTVTGLKEMLARRVRKVKLVVISGRFARMTARYFLLAGIEHVVCCPSISIGSMAYIDFMECLYSSLGRGKTLQEAVSTARQQVSSYDPAAACQILLLPEQPQEDDSNYHGVQILYATRVVNRTYNSESGHTFPQVHQTNQNNNSNANNTENRSTGAIVPQNIPTDMDVSFRGRDVVEMHQVLHSVQENSTLTVHSIDNSIGAIQKSKAAYTYIRHRHREYNFHQVCWIDLANANDNIANDGNDTTRVIRNFFQMMLQLNDVIDHSAIEEDILYQKMVQQVSERVTLPLSSSSTSSSPPLSYMLCFVHINEMVSFPSSNTTTTTAQKTNSIDRNDWISRFKILLSRFTFDLPFCKIVVVLAPC